MLLCTYNYLFILLLDLTSIWAKETNKYINILYNRYIYKCPILMKINSKVVYYLVYNIYYGRLGYCIGGKKNRSLTNVINYAITISFINMYCFIYDEQ